MKAVITLAHKDGLNETVLLLIESPNDLFLMGVYNKFIADMVALHGPSFAKIDSHRANGRIYVKYTHHVSAEISP